MLKLDEAKGVLQFIAHLNYFGPAMTPELAKISTDEISRMWNEPKAEVVFRGRKYATEFVITYTTDRPAPNARDNCANNFIEIAPMTHPGDRSYYQLLGQNGRFYTSDELGVSTTTAHEFGHGLGLDHNDYDQRSAPVPGIMFARGTWVRPEFQWDPNAQAGAPGGSVRPHFRKVRAEDVQAIELQAIQLNSAGQGCLGGKANKQVVVD